MGLENNSNAIYLTISNGKICRQVASKTEASKERTNKNGKLVHEEFYDKISGMLTDIKVREVEIAGQQSKFWELKIEDDGKFYQLQFLHSNQVAAAADAELVAGEIAAQAKTEQLSLQLLGPFTPPVNKICSIHIQELLVKGDNLAEICTLLHRIDFTACKSRITFRPLF